MWHCENTVRINIYNCFQIKYFQLFQVSLMTFHDFMNKRHIAPPKNCRSNKPKSFQKFMQKLTLTFNFIECMPNMKTF